MLEVSQDKAHLRALPWQWEDYGGEAPPFTFIAWHGFKERFGIHIVRKSKENICINNNNNSDRNTKNQELHHRHVYDL